MENSEASFNVIEKEKPENFNPLFEKYKALSTIKRAIRASARFNKKFNKQRTEERKAYFDMQTMSVHYPQAPGKNKINNFSSVGHYPVAIYPWQYQDYYQKYTSEELEKLPVNTPLRPIVPSKSLYKDDYLSKINEYKEYCRKRVAEKKLEQKAALEKEALNKTGPIFSLPNPNQNERYMSNEIGEPKSSNDETDTISIDSLQKTNQVSGDWCHVCGFPPLANSILKGHLVACTECSKTGHPACLGLTLKMSEAVLTYPWQCIECKTCSLCLNPGNEAELMCCDYCDRGCHTFCIGLKAIPEGQWICQLCQRAK